MIQLTAESLTVEQLVAVARAGALVAPLGAAIEARMESSHQWVVGAVASEDKMIYGVNTGFGSLANRQVSATQAQQLSRNVILACATGVDAPLPAEVVRGMMLVRANMLARGLSGVCPALATTLIAMLNAGVTPHVPGKGSLGASGDLAPLAHIAAVLTRDRNPAGDGYSGQAWYKGELMTGAEAMARAGIERQVLEAKEGLALTNGTDFMVASGALAIYDAERLCWPTPRSRPP